MYKRPSATGRAASLFSSLSTIARAKANAVAGPWLVIRLPKRKKILIYFYVEIFYRNLENFVRFFFTVGHHLLVIDVFVVRSKLIFHRWIWRDLFSLSYAVRFEGGRCRTDRSDYSVLTLLSFQQCPNFRWLLNQSLIHAQHIYVHLYICRKKIEIFERYFTEASAFDPPSPPGRITTSYVLPLIASDNCSSANNFTSRLHFIVLLSVIVATVTSI